MTESDYLNKEKYPLTTQGDLSYTQQKLIDSFNYDQLMEVWQNQETLTERQIAIFQELAEKLNKVYPFSEQRISNSP